MSGITPSSSIANHRPARPIPDWISSAMNTIPFAAANSASPAMKPGAGTMNPPSPWIGSIRIAAMFSSPMCLCISSIAYARQDSAHVSSVPPVGQRYG